jgi:hypothetical protein
MADMSDFPITLQWKVPSTSPCRRVHVGNASVSDRNFAGGGSRCRYLVLDEGRVAIVMTLKRAGSVR